MNHYRERLFEIYELAIFLVDAMICRTYRLVSLFGLFYNKKVYFKEKILSLYSPTSPYVGG